MSRRIIVLFLICFLSMTSRSHAQAPLNSTPNDPRFKDQWIVDRIGLQCAWQHTTGSPDVTVAVIDSGVDMNHPDLKAALRDDGYDTVDEDNDPDDENGHGTNVAGIIAASINNGEGVAGVAGGGTKILPIRVMDADGSGTNQDIIEGIEYAVSKDVQIINMSLGSLLPLDSEDIVDAIKRANDAGVLVIVAAGNSFVPLPNFAFGIEQYAVVVAATDQQDRKTDFSNYGKWVAVSAPGYEILSTMPTRNVFLTSDALPREERFKQNYDTMSGTSQATPVVAGVAALVFAQHPDWTAQQVRQELQKTATDISALNPKKTVGPITYFEPSNLGTGRINACDALGGPIDPNAPAAGGDNKTASTLNPLVLAAIGVGSLLLLSSVFFVLRRRKKTPVVAPPAMPPAGYPNQPYPPQPNYPPPAVDQRYAPPLQPHGQPSAPQPHYQPVPPESFAPPPRQASPVAPMQQPPSQPMAQPSSGTRSTPSRPLQMPTMPAWGKLTVISGADGAKFFLLRDPSSVIGRETGSTIVLANDNTVSRRHAVIRRTERGFEIEDAGSSHGTKVNGQPIRQATAIQSGDTIEIGLTKLRFEA